MYVWNVCSNISHLLAKNDKFKGFTHTTAVFTLAVAMISRDNTHKAFYVSEETSPNRAQTVIIFALFFIYFCSSWKPDLMPPYQICFIILHSTTTQKLALLTSDARLFN